MNEIYIWIFHPLAPRYVDDAYVSVHRIVHHLFQLDFYANSLPANANYNHK